MKLVSRKVGELITNILNNIFKIKDLCIHMYMYAYAYNISICKDTKSKFVVKNTQRQLI